MTEPQIIYVTGMKPKPPPDLHKEELERVLLAGLSRSKPRAAALLGAHPDWFRLVSWTYDFYGSYRDMSLDAPGIERLLVSPEPTPAEKREIDSIRRRLLRLWHLFGDSAPWLMHLVARPDLRLTLDEVLRYLLDVDGVGRSIRDTVRAALLAAWRDGRPVMLVGHSLGSVIGYDTLWELTHDGAHKGRVDWFVSLGSPLATRFVRKHVKGADRRGTMRYPHNISRWLNCSARGDMTTLHRRLKPFYGGIVELGLAETLIDRADLYNHFHADFGLNPHKSYGYLINDAVASAIGDWVEAHAAG